MYYSYTTYPDGLHTAYSQRHPDGSIHFVFEWPMFMDMGTARCTIPVMTWDELHGVEEGDLERMEAYVRENLDLMEELADEAASSPVEKGRVAYAQPVYVSRLRRLLLGGRR